MVARSLIGQACDDCRSAKNVIADFHEGLSVERQIYFGSRAEANHSEAIAFFEFIAHVRPGDDASRNGAGQLSDDNCSARILKGPYHCFIFLRTIGPACIETEPLSMLTINDAATDR